MSEAVPKPAPQRGSEPEAEEVRIAEAAAPLDALLSDAALGGLRRFLPGLAGVKFAAGLAARPAAVGRRLGALAGELGRIAVGTCELEPSRRDKRFADQAWASNWLLHRAVQAYLAASRTGEQLVEEVPLDWRSEAKIRFLAENLRQALAPSNTPGLNPASLKALVDTGGKSLLDGLRNLLGDMARPPRVPSMVDTSQFGVGRNIAVTPGVVVLRTGVFELIQYAPATAEVREVPLLIVPPVINKFYVVDLAPGRSMVEHFVGSGQQTFVISWRNPDGRHADWGMDTYVQSVIEAMDAVQRICRVERSVLFGLCAGGILTSLAMGHLAAIGAQQRVAALALGVTVLDQNQAGTTTAVVDRNTARLAAAVSGRRGYLDGRQLAEVFAWLRPGDLIWSYWVNNYLLGRKPPAFDVLFWNADTTRMAARLHREFLQLAVDNALVTPGEAVALGTPVDLSAVTVDNYVVAGIADHICRWQSCYRSVALLGGDSRFVLSTSGHIAAMVNPPGNPKASYQVNKANPEDPEEWLRTAVTEQGTWWTDFTDWLGERSGGMRAAPTELGGAGLVPRGDAPGTYVFDS